MRVANIIEDARIAGPQLRNLKVSKTLKKKILVTLIFPKENSKILENLCRKHNVDYLTLSLTTIKRSLTTKIFQLLYFLIQIMLLLVTLKMKLKRFIKKLKFINLNFDLLNSQCQIQRKKFLLN